MLSSHKNPRRPPLTRIPAWRALAAHRRIIQPQNLRALFSADPQRYSRFSLEACGLLLDYSKNRITAETLDLLCALALACDVPQRLNDLLAGKPVNTTEKRAAWHTALRAGTSAPAEVQRTLADMRAFAQSLREGQLRGATSQPYTDVISLGVGGSALGPMLAVAACAPDAQSPRVHFVATPDETLERLLKRLDPACTLVIAQSKSFTTRETLLCLDTARTWLSAALGKAGDAHLAAVTARPDAAQGLGIAAQRIFPLWDWVGGRYSLWSATGLPAMIAMGPQAFDRLLAGAAAMDRHAAEAPLARNMPALLALIGLWNNNFLGYAARAVMPYAQGLSLLPKYLQQLEMESLGKTVDHRGKPVRTQTGALLWGGYALEDEHACFQWLHQGSAIVPVDFIACCAPAQSDGHTAHELQLARCLAQSALLACGVTANEARQVLLDSGRPKREAARLAPHQALPGNRPSNTLLLPALDPQSLGTLLALYEHRTYVQSTILDINAFDQWGVEHGKKLSGSLLPELSSAATATAHDASTSGLVNYIKAKRKTP